MYETYLEFPESNDNYIQQKIERRYHNLLKTMHMREKVDILINVAMHFLKEVEASQSLVEELN